MNISVIIPVYNAAAYVVEAVESALIQPETAEVILIEDGSPDKSLAVCHALAEKYDKVLLLRHPRGENRGASASRNLGMKHALYEYIAFLDADDYYLPGRFKVAKEIFETYPDCDGVYEAMGISFENVKAKQRWLDSIMANVEFTTITDGIDPEELFDVFIGGLDGHFHINGLVIKRGILGKTGLMNEALKLHEDTDFILRLAAVGKLLPGRLDVPVSMRRVHGENTISTRRPAAQVYKSQMNQWISTYNWLIENDLNQYIRPVLNVMIWKTTRSKHFNYTISEKIPPSILRRIRLLLWALEWPEAVKHRVYWVKLLQRVY